MHKAVCSPVGLWEQDRRVRFADEVLIGHFADGHYPFLAAGYHLQGEGGLHLWPKHAQVRGQHVDEDLRGERLSLSTCCLNKQILVTKIKVILYYIFT